MKMLATLLLLSNLACLPSLAQATRTNSEAVSTNSAPLKLQAADAKLHINADARVTGRVAEVNIAERLIRLNFEKPYPNQVFTAVIFAPKTNLFPEVARLKDKTVEISGKIADYHGRPEIILTTTNQLRIVEVPSAAAGAEKK
jgi:hypothetical protein